MDDADLCFIVGSPRSGTTILGEALGRHSAVAQFYEPYFIWDRHLGPGDDDVRTADQATSEIARYVRAEFDWFRRRAGKSRLIEKSPENSLRIPFVRAIFPGARWIHAVRDGRDAVVSINREWERRRDIIENRRIGGFATVIAEMMACLPYWRNRAQAVRHELGQRLSLSPSRYFTKAKWDGAVGWGPRFAGWREALAGTDDVLRFNARQWRACVEAVRRDLADVPAHLRTEVRYETFATAPDAELARLFDFLGVPHEPGLAGDVDARAVGQWRRVLDADQQARVVAEIGDLLAELGYDAADGGAAGTSGTADPAVRA